MGTKKLVCELTLRDGKVVYDLNGISADMWDAKAHSADESQSRRWTTFNERPFGAARAPRFPVYTPGSPMPPPAK
jgi:dihydroorotase